MKAVIGIVALAIVVVTGHLAAADERPAQPPDRTTNSGRFCVQVISCGTKNGVVREYPTPCAARDDGATDVTPKSGPSCGESK